MQKQFVQKKCRRIYAKFASNLAMKEN